MSIPRAGWSSLTNYFLAFGAIVSLALSLAELAVLRTVANTGDNPAAGLEFATRWSPLNWSYHYALASVGANFGDATASRKHFERSLELYPGCALCAIAFAESEARHGSDSRLLIEQAVRYGRSNTTVRVRAGTLYARIGEREKAAAEFSAAARGQRTNLNEFFTLLHRIYPDWFVLEHIVTDELLPAYFHFARLRVGPIAMGRVWARYEQLGVRAHGRDAYVEYLLRHGMAREAWTVAFGDHAPPVGNLLNGNFEDRLDPGRFSWRIADGDGVRAKIRDCVDCGLGGHALWFEFDGEKNVHYFGTSQYTPVKPGAVYRLSARVMADGLTSARGPALAVLGLKGEEGDFAQSCDLWVIGEEFRRTFAWRNTSMVFAVPQDCEGIRVMVTRPRTRRLDKFIGGELWLDDVRLDEIASIAEPSVSDSTH